MDNLPDYADVCRALGIPWIAIHDTDRLADGRRKENTEKARKRLEALKTDTDLILEWENDLEEAVGYRAVTPEGKVKPQWVVAQLGSKSWSDLQKTPHLTRYTSVIAAADKRLRQT